MAHIHREPYITLAGVTAERALIAWGAFFFDISGEAIDGRFKLVEDKDLKHVNPPRSSSIGESSSDYGPAEIRVWEKGSDPAHPITVIVPSDSPATRVNHAWVEGLKPDTTYQYRLIVKGEPWAEEERRDWVTLGDRQGMFPNKRLYENEFTTYPRETDATPPFTFAVIGDYGKGMKEKDSPQSAVAEALALAVRTKGVRFVITTGDHIYGNGMFHSHDTGDEDSDWFFTHYQPYRYILNRVAFYPACGNHDAGETEKSDDYTQLLDNFYIRERFLSGDRDEGDAVNDHGLFYRFRFGKDIELLSVDSSKPDKSGPRAFALPSNASTMADFFPAVPGSPANWRIPFFHHPPYVDGPTKSNDEEAEERLVKPLLEPGGVRLVFNGHEHNFQVSRHNGIHYVLTGAAGEAREEPLGGDPAAHNIAWSPQHHFLLVEHTADGKMRVTPYGALKDGQLEPVVVTSPGGQPFPLPLEITLT
jgi:tartrate-resistant acid phosphatase type 5